VGVLIDPHDFVHFCSSSEYVSMCNCCQCNPMGIARERGMTVPLLPHSYGKHDSRLWELSPSHSFIIIVAVFVHNSFILLDATINSALQP
jgi:hypothetical protein